MTLRERERNRRNGARGARKVVNGGRKVKTSATGSITDPCGFL